MQPDAKGGGVKKSGADVGNLQKQEISDCEWPVCPANIL